MTDAIVIGSGPNGLVAANVLADAGWQVLVVEAQPEPGGTVRSGEITAPGFISDRFSSFHPLAVASRALRSLELERHGLAWARAPIALAHPRPDGRAAHIGPTVEATAVALEAATPGDAAGWRTLAQLWRLVGPNFLDTLLGRFPPVVPAARVARTLGPRGTAEFSRFALLSVRRLAQEYFRGEDPALLLAGNTAHSDLTVDAAGSGIFGWLLTSLAQDVGFPTPVGGASALTTALVRRFESRGGRVQCRANAVDIVINRGRAVAVILADGTEISARRAILADVSAPRLYTDLVGLDALPASTHRDLRRFQWDHATFKVDWALAHPAPWRAEEARQSAVIHLADSMQELSSAIVAVESGSLPAQPNLIVGQPDVADPTRCPPGRGTMWAYTHVPQHVQRDLGGTVGAGWAVSDRERFADRVEARIEAYAPGFRDTIIARHIASPLDLQASNANLEGGAINGGTAALTQQFVFRPTLGRAGPNTPIRSLYLASASAHPGGGVHGACGANAARSALAAYTRRRALSAVTRRVG